MMEKFCLQCGSPLILKSVAADPVYPYGPQVSACSSCNSRSYAVSGNKIKELTKERNELLAALKEVFDDYNACSIVDEMNLRWANKVKSLIEKYHA